MLPNIVHGPVTPEWHRLACREAVDRSADYWIYADYPEWLVAGTPQNEEFARVRCSTNVIRTVVFENEEMRDRFHRVINICIMGKFHFPPNSCFLHFVVRNHHFVF